MSNHIQHLVSKKSCWFQPSLSFLHLDLAIVKCVVLSCREVWCCRSPSFKLGLNTSHCSVLKLARFRSVTTRYWWCQKQRGKNCCLNHSTPLSVSTKTPLGLHKACSDRSYKPDMLSERGDPTKQKSAQGPAVAGIFCKVLMSLLGFLPANLLSWLFSTVTEQQTHEDVVFLCFLFVSQWCWELAYCFQLFSCMLTRQPVGVGDQDCVVKNCINNILLSET